MLLHAKLRGLPALDGVALRTLPFAHSFRELAFVRVGGMAIRALGKSQRLLEIASRVAIAAADFQVHPEKRIFRFRMVELH